MAIINNNRTRLFPGSLTTWIILSASLLLAVFAIWTAFFSKDIFDQKIFDCIDPHKTPGRTAVVQFITWGGNTFFLIGANVLLFSYFIYKKNKWLAIRVAAISLSSVGMMGLIKNLIHRHRPSQPMVEGVTNFSFPSGHAFMSVAFYGLLIWLVVIRLKNEWQKRVAIAFLILLILTIGFTRIYLRMHYATDVIAGICMSTIWIILCFTVIRYFETKQKAKK